LTEDSVEVLRKRTGQERKGKEKSRYLKCKQAHTINGGLGVDEAVWQCNTVQCSAVQCSAVPWQLGIPHFEKVRMFGTSEDWLWGMIYGRNPNKGISRLEWA